MLNMRSTVMAAVIGATLLLCMTAPALAQTATTGAINGRVTDTTGADVPGVTVTITSPALMGAQTTITTAEGGYRFPSVPPGDYQITFNLSGFATLVRGGIRVGGAFTATVNVELAVASLAETVTVVGASPIVDVQATRVQTSFTTEQLESLPGARDMWAILSQTPGVRMSRIDVGGANAGTQTGYSAYGGGPNRPMVEGMVMSQGSGGNAFMYYDYGSFEEVVVTTAGHGADMPTPGVQMQFIAKSGGNTFSGRFYSDYEHERIQGRNIDAEQIRLGADGRDSNRLYRYHFVNLDSGGPIKADKTWWYASFMDQRILARVPNLPVTDPTDSLLRNPTGKITSTLSKADRLIAFYQGNYKYFPNRVDGTRVTGPIYPSVTGTRKQTYYGWVYKGEWNRVVNDRVFFELRAGQVSYRNEYAPNTTDPQKEDLSTLVVTGAQLHSKPADNPTRDQVIGNLSVFKNGWGGSHSSHNFKLGGEFFKEFTEGGIPEDHVAQYFNNGAPVEVTTWQGPSLARSGAWVWSGYGNDTWSVGPKVTLNLGLRYDGYQAFLPVQDRPASRFSPVPLHYDAVPNMLRWNMWAPRFGVVYNVKGDGRTVVKVNAGKYWWTPSYSLPAQLNPNANAPFLRYAWTDPNRNGLWEPGEEGRLLAQGGGSNIQLDPNLENTYSNEVSTSFERELRTNVGVRAGVIWRGHRQRYKSQNSNRPYEAFNVPISVTDPGPDGRVGTADDSARLTLFNLDPSRLGLVDNRITNVRGNDDFYTFEISANRRKVGRFNLVADYSQTWAREGAQPSSPSDIVNTDPDGRHHTTGWNAKVHGTIDAPWSLRVTPLLRHQSGDPWGRTFVVTMNYGSQTVLAEAKSTRRVANVTNFDLRVERYFQVSRRNRISAMVDVYNMFNANPEVQIVQSSGASFLRPRIIMPPRIIRFGTNVTW